MLDCSNVEEITKGLRRLFFRSFSLLCKNWPKSKVTQDLGSGSRAVAIISEDFLCQIWWRTDAVVPRVLQLITVLPYITTNSTFWLLDLPTKRSPMPAMRWRSQKWELCWGRCQLSRNFSTNFPSFSLSGTGMCLDFQISTNTHLRRLGSDFSLILWLPLSDLYFLTGDALGHRVEHAAELRVGEAEGGDSAETRWTTERCISCSSTWP